MFMHSYIRRDTYAVNQLFFGTLAARHATAVLLTAGGGGGVPAVAAVTEQPEAGPVAGGLRPEGSAAERYHQSMAEDLKEGSQSRVGGSQQNRTRPRAIGAPRRGKAQ